MLLRFQKPAVRENCETGNQAFSMRLRFLTIRYLHGRSELRQGWFAQDSRRGKLCCDARATCIDDTGLRHRGNSQGATCNRDAIGARILWKAAGKLRHRLKNSGGSYLSSQDLREVLGIGAAAQIDELEIHWPAPSKRIEKLTNLAPNRYIRIIEGQGMV